ncbi:translesion DNA synthesis-associated protein ImuA [soil metagenome]
MNGLTRDAAAPSTPAIPDSVWRADQLAQAAGRVESSRHAALDAQLPGGGWPLGALVELLLPHPGVGELQLIAPAVSAACDIDSRQALFIGTPHNLYGPALGALHWDLARLMLVDAQTPADRLWAAEQALRCPAIGALMVWLPKARVDQLRRLHLAAQASEMLVFIVRPLACRNESSPAPLRITCQASFEGRSSTQRSLSLDIVKRRGPALDAPVRVDFTLPVSMRASSMHAARVRDERSDARQPHVLDSTRLRATADRSAHVH